MHPLESPSTWEAAYFIVAVCILFDVPSVTSEHLVSFVHTMASRLLGNRMPAAPLRYSHLALSLAAYRFFVVRAVRTAV